MPLVGMYAYSSSAIESGGDLSSSYPRTWTWPIKPPAEAFAQVSLASFSPVWDEGQPTAQCGITQITHRMDNGKDEPIPFPSNFYTTEEKDIVRIAYDKKMSSITVQLNVHNLYATYMLQVFVYG
jgi:hypothetical protein